jgi:predicted RNA-binding Zn-ribbon protein involved in translation (DUF1610 family)
MTTVSDSYPKNQSLSDDELKEVLKAKYSAGNTKTEFENPDDTSKFHTEVVHLPSKGLLYPESNPLSSGQIHMKYMTAKEEDILTSQNLIKSGVVIDKLLQSLIVSKINYNDLLVGDKNALLVAARILAYGKDYEVEITCPKCGEKSTHVVDLSTFEDKEPKEGTYTKGANEFWFELPASKRKVSFKCLTSADEKGIEAELKGLKKLTKITGIDSEMTTRLKYLITSVDGESDITVIRKFVDTELLSRDSFALRKYIQDVSPDIKMEFMFECPSCGHEVLDMAMPMTVSFFWPRA